VFYFIAHLDILGVFKKNIIPFPLVGSDITLRIYSSEGKNES